jgi:predicted RND superfamily exporter protein
MNKHNKTQTNEILEADMDVVLEEAMEVVSDVQADLDNMDGVPNVTKVDAPVAHNTKSEGVEKADTIKVDKEKFEETVNKYKNDIEIYKKSPRYATHYDVERMRWHVRDKQTDSTRYIYDEEVTE